MDLGGQPGIERIDRRENTVGSNPYEKLSNLLDRHAASRERKNMNKDSTLLFCGTISTYNATEPVPGPYNYWQILARTITVKGYLVSDHYHRIEEGQAALSKWVKDDKIKFREHINEGIENCLDTYNLLFTGGNEGKLMLKL